MMFKRYLKTVCETTFSGDDELLTSSSLGCFAVHQLSFVEENSPCNSVGNFAEQHQQQLAYNDAEGKSEDFFPGMAKYSSESSKSSLPSIEQIFLAADSSTLNRVVPINKSYNPASTQFKSFNNIEG